MPGFFHFVQLFPIPLLRLHFTPPPQHSSSSDKRWGDEDEDDYIYDDYDYDSVGNSHWSNFDEEEEEPRPVRMEKLHLSRTNNFSQAFIFSGKQRASKIMQAMRIPMRRVGHWNENIIHLLCPMGAFVLMCNSAPPFSTSFSLSFMYTNPGLFLISSSLRITPFKTEEGSSSSSNQISPSSPTWSSDEASAAAGGGHGLVSGIAFVLCLVLVQVTCNLGQRVCQMYILTAKWFSPREKILQNGPSPSL